MFPSWNMIFICAVTFKSDCKCKFHLLKVNKWRFHFNQWIHTLIFWSFWFFFSTIVCNMFNADFVTIWDASWRLHFCVINYLVFELYLIKSSLRKIFGPMQCIQLSPLGGMERYVWRVAYVFKNLAFKILVSK